MIENQSDNIDIKENDVSNQENAPEDTSSAGEQIIENDELSSQKTEEINTEELKNTISNNDARLEQLEKEHETLKNQYVRISADFDNFRKRQSRDQDDLKIQLVSKTLTAILPIVDNFERARQQLKPESEEAQALHRSYQGLYKQLVEVLKQQGVSPMRVVGQQFDPNLHEAVLREPSEEFQEDFIVEELQRGYHLEGKVLRHALVKVSMGPGKQNSQELEEKANNIDENLSWHFIGPLQSNKAKIIAKYADWIHTIDRKKIADKINEECKKINKIINACIQVNISNESTKSGINPENLMIFAKYVDSMENINLKGIMVLPSLGENNKKQMQDSKLLHEELISVFPHAEYLSMGTTSDFETAIVSGSNMIRVGELIFGKR